MAQQKLTKAQRKALKQLMETGVNGAKSSVTKRGYVDKVAATETTKWSRPWNLFVITPLGPVWLGRYTTEGGARAAAKRRGIEVPASKHRASRRLP